MRFTYRQTIKRCLIAVAVTLFGLLAWQGTASAVVTEAPEITATPGNPNTTHAKTVFKYTVGEGETSEVSPLRFYCRNYPTASPPAPSSGWISCGQSTDAQPSTREISNLANNDYTFDVAARESTSFATQGPSASYSWTQNLVAPSLAPTATVTPEDPTLQLESRFQYEMPEAEATLSDRLQCRLDGGDWIQCSAEWIQYLSPITGNGEHTFEARGGNQIGWGPPSEPFTWTVDVAQPEPNVRVDEIASERWDGYPGRKFGGTLQGLSANQTKVSEDINGDGKKDILVAGMAGGTVAGGPPTQYYLLFAGRGGGSVDELNPNQGYSVSVPHPIKAADSLGDQNGDGIADSVVSVHLGPGPAGFIRTYVVYGVDDPSSLPRCEVGKATRCLDVTTMGPDQGYSVADGLALSPVNTLVRANVGLQVMNAGDFDGDGVDDILFVGSQVFRQAAVLKGGVERTGEIDITDIDEDQVFRAFRAYSPVQLGTVISAVGDLNQDGKDDVSVMDMSNGLNYVIFGRGVTGPDLELTSFEPADGLIGATTALAPLTLRSIGDWNVDGRPDLSASSDPLKIMYMPETPFDGFLIPGEDLPVDQAVSIESTAYGELGASFNPGQMGSAGDFDNDGRDDILFATNEPSDGFSSGGMAYLLANGGLGGEDIEVGLGLEPGDGVAILPPAGMSKTQGSFGAAVESIGDVDGDGLTDFVIGHSGADYGGVDAGAVYLVPGKNLIDQVKTQQATAASNSSAVLNAGLSTNSRDSEVWFEYGTSDEYGQTTATQQFEGSGAGDAVSAAIDGLEKATTYHYRAVARNELGLVRYGDDMTFTTTNTTPASNCDTDNTLPGCSGWDPCAADNTKPGCSGYDHCAVKPTDCAGSTKVRLAVIAITKKMTVKRGKRGTVQVAVINTGGKAAKGVKVCVKAPKRLVKVKKCVKVGSLGSGASRTVKVKVQAKKKRGKALLNLTASGNGVGKKKAKARVVIR